MIVPMFDGVGEDSVPLCVVAVVFVFSPLLLLRCEWCFFLTGSPVVCGVRRVPLSGFGFPPKYDTEKHVTTSGTSFLDWG